MATLSTTYDPKSGDKSTLATNITTTDTTIKIAAIRRNGTDVAWSTTKGIIEVRQERNGELIQEWISYDGLTTNSDNTVTLTSGNVSRDVSPTGTSYTGDGTGQRFNKGAEVRMVVFHKLLNDKADVDRANTFSATNTFSTHQLISGTNEWRFSDSATAIWDDGTNLSFKDSSNATITLATIAAAAGADVKVGIDVAAAADFIGAVSSDGVLRTGDGLSYIDGGDFVTVDVVMLKDASSTELTIATGSITRTGSAHTVDTQSDDSTDDLDTIAGGTDGDYITITAANTARTIVVKDAVDNILTADSSDFSIDDIDKSITLRFDGTNWKEVARAGKSLVTRQAVLVSGADYTTLTNPTSLTAFDTHTFTIPANDLVAGVAYEFEVVIDAVTGTSGTMNIGLDIGGTSLTSSNFASTGADPRILIKGAVYGTTSAGASASVKGIISGVFGTGSGDLTTTQGATENRATNGTLVIEFTFLFGTSNGSNTAKIISSRIDKVSATAF